MPNFSRLSLYLSALAESENPTAGDIRQNDVRTTMLKFPGTPDLSVSFDAKIVHALVELLRPKALMAAGQDPDSPEPSFTPMTVDALLEEVREAFHEEVVRLAEGETPEDNVFDLLKRICQDKLLEAAAELDAIIASNAAASAAGALAS
jgi:hypothetical protein